MSRSPFWNQDAVMAAGLAFAGMAMLQSKLFTIVSKLNEPFLAKLAIWWPLLLVVGGLAVWFKKISEKRSQSSSRSASAGGATGGAK